MRVAAQIVLSPKEEKALRKLASGRSCSVRLAQRSAIVLLAADGLGPGLAAAEGTVAMSDGRLFVFRQKGMFSPLFIFVWILLTIYFLWRISQAITGDLPVWLAPVPVLAIVHNVNAKTVPHRLRRIRIGCVDGVLGIKQIAEVQFGLVGRGIVGQTERVADHRPMGAARVVVVPIVRVVRGDAEV